MPEQKNTLVKAWQGVQAVGLAKTIQVAIYPLRRAYHEARFSQGGQRGSVLRGIAGVLAASRQPTPELQASVQDWNLVGNVLSYQQTGQTVTLHCQNAVLELTILAADVLRVRLASTQPAQAGQVYQRVEEGCHGFRV